MKGRLGAAGRLARLRSVRALGRTGREAPPCSPTPKTSRAKEIRKKSSAGHNLPVDTGGADAVLFTILFRTKKGGEASPLFFVVGWDFDNAEGGAG